MVKSGELSVGQMPELRYLAVKSPLLRHQAGEGRGVEEARGRGGRYFGATVIGGPNAWAEDLRRWLDLLAVEWRARRLLIRGAEARLGKERVKAALASGAMDLRCPREDAVWLALPLLPPASDGRAALTLVM